MLPEDDQLESAKKLTSEQEVNTFTPKKPLEGFNKAKTILDHNLNEREFNIETRPRSKKTFHKKVSLYSQPSLQNSRK